MQLRWFLWWVIVRTKTFPKPAHPRPHLIFSHPPPFRPYNHNILHRKELLSHNILNFTLSNKFPKPFPLDFFPQNNIVSPCCFGAGFSKVFRTPLSPPLNPLTSLGQRWKHSRINTTFPLTITPDPILMVF